MNSFNYQTQAASDSTALYLLGFARVGDHHPHFVQTDTRSILASLEFAKERIGEIIDYQPLLEELGIECVQVGCIVAWFKRIDRSEFTGAVGESNLSNLDWLTPRVLAHETVVAKLSECFPFYPSRFGCLFSNLEKIVDFTRANHSTLHEFFQRVAGRCEWGIKFVADVDRSVACMADEALLSDGKTSAGVNYLRLKQLQRQLRPITMLKLEDQCVRFIAELQQIFQHIVVRSTSPKASPDRESVISNVACLLTPNEATLLAHWHNSFATRTDNPLRIEPRLTGPWPAYCFCPPLSTDQANEATESRPSSSPSFSAPHQKAA